MSFYIPTYPNFEKHDLVAFISKLDLNIFSLFYPQNIFH